METEAKNKAWHSLEGHTIHIVGPHLFSYQVLSNMLETETRAACCCVKSFEDITNAKKNSPQPEDGAECVSGLSGYL